MIKVSTPSDGQSTQPNVAIDSIEKPSKQFEIEIENTPVGPLKGVVRLVEPPKGKPPSPWVSELPRAIITLLTVSIFGGLVSMAFNYKSWRENQRIDRAKIEMAKAQATYSKVTEEVSKRIHQTFILMRGIENGVDANDADAKAEWRALSKEYRNIVDDWNGYIRLRLKQTEYDIDHAVADKDNTDFDMIGTLHTKIIQNKSVVCQHSFKTQTKVARPVDWSKASWLLAGIHVCFVELTTKFNSERDAIQANTSRAERTKAIEPHKKRLYAIQQHAIQFISRGGYNLRDAKKETQTRSFLNYMFY